MTQSPTPPLVVGLLDNNGFSVEEPVQGRPFLLPFRLDRGPPLVFGIPFLHEPQHARSELILQRLDRAVTRTTLALIEQINRLTKAISKLLSNLTASLVRADGPVSIL